MKTTNTTNRINPVRGNLLPRFKDRDQIKSVCVNGQTRYYVVWSENGQRLVYLLNSLILFKDNPQPDTGTRKVDWTSDLLKSPGNNSTRLISRSEAIALIERKIANGETLSVKYPKNSKGGRMFTALNFPKSGHHKGQDRKIRTKLSVVLKRIASYLTQWINIKNG